jgi:hypothetical protein
MATKTLILRPASITCDNESLVTLYPADTTMANAHILVNEESSDEDATYITGGLGSNISYHFVFTKPENLKNITGFSFTVRHKLEANSSQHSISYNMYLGSDNYTLCTMTENPTTYVDMIDTITDDIKSTIVGTLDDANSVNFYITQAVATGNSNKSKPIRTTQMYIEITYETNDIVLQYFKQGDAWISLGEFSMYYKRNHRWDLLNDSQLDSHINKNYLIEVIK